MSYCSTPICTLWGMAVRLLFNFALAMLCMLRWVHPVRSQLSGLLSSSAASA